MNRTRRKRIEGALGATAFGFARHRFLGKPIERVEVAGERLGRLLFRVARKRRELALSNLSLAFPEMGDAERRRVARTCFEHFGRTAATFLSEPPTDLASFEATCEFAGYDYLQAALAQGRGAILITGHFGNWERMAAWVVAHGHALSVVARDTDDHGLNAQLNALRERSGMKVIARGNAARPIIECLRRNECVGILPDQNADEIYLPFFGQPAGTVLGPGVIAERTGAPVLPGYGVWIGRGRYRIEIGPLLIAEPSETKGEGVMRAINASLEEVIRRHPEQWLWFHDRWRNARRRGLLGSPPALR